MSMPNPAALAQRLTDQKQAQMKLESSSSTKPASKVSRSSEKGKAAVTSSKLEEKVTSNPVVAKPSQKSSSSTSTEVPPSKKPFVLRPHLTQRLSQNEELQKLRDSLPQNRRQNHSPKRSSKRSGS